MQILIVAATEQEITITREWLHAAKREINVLISGIGCNATAYALTRRIVNARPDLVIQAGIGGSFTPALPPGTAAFITSEVEADLGATDQQGIIDIFDLGLADANGYPFTDRRLVNPDSARWSAFGLPFAAGATVNGVSSDAFQAERIRQKYAAMVESMEGAALHYVCLQEKVPFIQLRAISNFAGERNKRNWKLAEAITVLNAHLRTIIESL